MTDDAIIKVLSPFAALARIAFNSGIEPREFIAGVNAHIEALQAWEIRRLTIERDELLRSSARPRRSECDSDETFRSAVQFWELAQAIRHGPNPAPSAPIAVERAIAVDTAADGSRSYTYIEDENGVSAYRDNVIRRSRGDG